MYILYHLFVAGSFDKANNTIHSAAYLTEDGGAVAAKTILSQAITGGPSNAQMASFTAFQIGVLMARMAGEDAVIVHGDGNVEHDILTRSHIDKTAYRTTNGMIDYFGNGVYVRLPGKDEHPEPWWDDITSKCEDMCEGALIDCAQTGL